MRSVKVIAAAPMLGLPRALCASDNGACAPGAVVRFEFSQDALMDFSHGILGRPIRALQFVIADDEQAPRFNWRFQNFAPAVAPEFMEIFNRVIMPHVNSLRSDFPKYFCQPLLEGDELQVTVDMFHDRLDDIFAQVRGNTELAQDDAPLPSLLLTALYLALPPLCSEHDTVFGHYPRELISLIHRVEEYRLGRERWREALERAQRSGSKYEGPVPAAVRQPDTTKSQFWRDNWSRLPDDIWLYVLCMTGAHVWYARLVCWKWRLVSSPRAMVGVLGYGRAFKILSGRVVHDELVVRLDSLARKALLELKDANVSGLGGGSNSNPIAAVRASTSTSTSTSEWDRIISGIREIVRAIDPIRALYWYRDAQAKFPGLDKILEDVVFGLFLSHRDAGFVSAPMMEVLSGRTINGLDVGWNESNQGITVRIYDKYLEKYPDNSPGHFYLEEEP